MRPGSVVPMWVKVCGLSEASGVAAAVDAGADAIGFVFAPGSPRTVEPELVASLLADVPESVLTVGVFRRQSVEEVSRIDLQTFVLSFCPCCLCYVRMHC